MNKETLASALQLYHILRSIRDLLATVDGELADLELQIERILAKY